MLRRSFAAALLAAPLLAPSSAPEAAEADLRPRHRSIEADGVRVFYREAGRADRPVVLLLHGFPSSSHMFRDLIPRLAGSYRVIAPDLPGFGLTEVPAARRYAYSFAGLAETMARFTEALGLSRYAIYVFDYGAPVGFRLALRNPERLAAVITQNGNAYAEGLSSAWSPIQAYWRDPSAANREALRQFLTVEVTRFQYLEGEPDPSLVSPDGWRLDQAGLDRPGNAEIQLDLFGDYQSNVALYPRIQAWLRAAQPPLLAAWGRNDPFFLPAGATAYQRDVPAARVVLYDAGHFALETRGAEIADEMLRFLGNVRF
jgi:pimeloyl-ACP methyl ester carboxylesterase